MKLRVLARQRDVRGAAGVALKLCRRSRFARRSSRSKIRTMANSEPDREHLDASRAHTETGSGRRWLDQFIEDKSWLAKLLVGLVLASASTAASLLSWPENLGEFIRANQHFLVALIGGLTGILSGFISAVISDKRRREPDAVTQLRNRVKAAYVGALRSCSAAALREHRHE